MISPDSKDPSSHALEPSFLLESDALRIGSDAEIDQLSEALDTLFAVQRDFLADVARRLGVLEIDVRAILYVSRRNQVSPKTLARHLRLTAGGATTVIDRMQARGYFDRERNPQDRRSLFVMTTPTGERVATAIRQTFGNELAHCVHSSRDRRTITLMIQQLNRRLGSSTDTERHPRGSRPLSPRSST